MDDQVLRGMAKWPNVPAVYGWLELDRRGNWLIRGEPITNPTVTEYIGRNYERDAEGRWFFQNGPQRVFVQLEYTPFVYRAMSERPRPLRIETHTGQAATALTGAWMDEQGALLLETEHGVGVVHDHDLDAVLPALIDANGGALPEATLDEVVALLQDGRDAPAWLKIGDANVKLKPLRSAEVPERFDFVAHPTEHPESPAVASAR
ncbi:MAG TPA: DUF2946 family protein [Burkholderiales bacterium]|nr:DUF2946 family protein [Burkholderiales bacterium]